MIMGMLTWRIEKKEDMLENIFARVDMRIVKTNARMIIYDDRTLTWISDDWIFIILLFCL